MQTVLITGANGFVGYYLTQQLLKNNYKVIAAGKGSNRLMFQHKNFLYETLDFTNKEAVKTVINKYEPHIIVHSGAMSKPDECEVNKEAAYLTNVTGTIYLLKEAQKLKSYFLFMSTDFVFDGTRLNYVEEDTPAPVNYYGHTKWLAEGEVQQYPFDWSIVRTILLYGHPQSGKQNILTIVVNALKEGRELRIVDDQTRMPTYVEDLATAMTTMINKRIKGIFHLSGKDVTTPYKMACAVADYKKLDKTLIRRVTADVFKELAKRPPVTGFDLTKATKELSYAPISFEEGLRKTFEDNL